MDYVYKYVLNDEIIYIGKGHDNKFSRMMIHGGKQDNISEKWHSEINKADIYYIKVANQTMADVVESELIRRYKPKCNVAKKSEWSGLMFPEPSWKPFRINNKYYEKIPSSQPKEGTGKRRKQIEYDSRVENRLKQLSNEVEEYKKQLNSERIVYQELVNFIEATTGKVLKSNLSPRFTVHYELIDPSIKLKPKAFSHKYGEMHCPFDPKIIELPNLDS